MPPDIEVACYAYEGINAVKDALRAGLAVSEQDLQVKVCSQPLPLFRTLPLALLCCLVIRHQSGPVCCLLNSLVTLWMPFFL